MTVDTFLAERELKMPLVIKIDVEDHEAAVLRGAAKTITCYQPMIVCEILPRPLRDPNNPSDNRPIAAPGMSRFVPHWRASGRAVHCMFQTIRNACSPVQIGGATWTDF